MKAYKANCFTAISPFGIIAKGGILSKRQLDALDEDALKDLIRRGVISVIGEEPEDVGTPDAAAEDADDEPEDVGTPDAAAEDVADDDEDDGEEAEEIGLAAMDAVLGEDAPEATDAEAPAEQPAKGRKKAAKPDKGGKQQ